MGFWVCGSTKTPQPSAGQALEERSERGGAAWACPVLGTGLGLCLCRDRGSQVQGREERRDCSERGEQEAPWVRVTDGSEVALQLPALRGSRDEDAEDFSLPEFPLTPASGLFPPVKTPQCDHISPGMLVPINR